MITRAHVKTIAMAKSQLISLLAAGASCAAIATSAQAQETTTDDVVVVTGTRIARDPNLTAPLPVQSLGSEEIKLSGEQDLTEVINDVPALLTTTTAENSLDGVFADAVGAAILNLRGLGAERTLVLVNGRRHVSGVAGANIVDINTIPNALVDSVEVLTGGASQVYGADAVTGVVNFILKRDFEGLDFSVNGGLAGEGDGERYGFSGVAGKNLFDDRFNVTVAFDYSKRQEIRFGDRDFSRNNGIADDLPNPALRFQEGDIDPVSTPNFFAEFNPANGSFPVGFRIPTSVGFTPTAAEQALIDRASNAPARVILTQPAFSISSNVGVIAPADLSSPNVDLDGNGTPDCLDSSVGFNSSFDFSQAFGFAGGCWVSNGDGTVRPYQDGLVAGVFNQFGGDGISNAFDQDYLTPDVRNLVGNLLLSYEFSDNVRWVFEGKIADTTATFGGPLNTFYDLLTVPTDNPFIPTQLAGVAADAGGLFVTRDPTDLGPNVNQEKRRTYRVVTGIEAEDTRGWEYEMTLNYGRFEREAVDRNRVITDRFFAAVDATTDGSGNPVCRSDLDPSAVPPTTPFGIPASDPGFFTFNPGDGQCAPYNVFGGFAGQSQAAIDFITTTITNEFVLEQFVVSGSVVGDLDPLVTLPGGSIGFATGFEYRAESSESEFDPLVRGVIPVTTPDATAGQLIRDIDNAQNSLVFDPASTINNETGDFNVWEYFVEASLPILQDRPFFEELTVQGGARFASYTTVGATLSWGVSGTWAPIDDIKFRASYAEPIRAPNITELFSPSQGAFFRPNDPCDQQQIDALINAGDPRGAIRQANCAADGIPAGFADPLSARFVGETSGNPDLQEERAQTFSVGGILQPRYVEGLSISVDYWSMQIENAIASVSAQDIVDNCYDSSNFPNQFCGLFSRNRDTTSPQFLGFDFLRQAEVNFASLDARGIDAQVSYDWDIGLNEFNVTLNGTWMERLNRFFDPGDPTALDPELGELQRPEFAANAFLTYARGPLTVVWQTQFQDEQALRSVEIETVDEIYGPAGIADAVFIHDISASYEISDTMQVYGGVNNLLDREPFITEQAFPVSPLGRYFFVGARFTM